MLKTKKFYFNDFHECCSVLWDKSKECVIVDPGFYNPQEQEQLFGFIEANSLKPVKILLTHGHFDHVFGVKATAAKYGIAVMMHPADKVILENNGFFCNMFNLREPDCDFETEDIKDGDVIAFGGETPEDAIRLEVLETPGHTPGGVCYLDRTNALLLSGDTLFAGSIGRTDNKWGDYDALMEGIMGKLMVLDGDITVFPGHGPVTSIADERMKNPFLQPFNLPYDEEELK